MKVKKNILLAVIAVVMMTGCGKSDTIDESGTKSNMKHFGFENNGNNGELTDIAEFDIDTEISSDYTDETYSENSEKIELTETVTISEPGTYILSGTIEDGQIVVDSKESGKVKLVFDGVNIMNSKGPAINIIDGKTIITLAADSVNSLTDGSTYDEGNEAEACIYSEKDLCINGGGILKINGNYLDGIKSKGDLRVINGNIDVKAARDGIKGKDSVVVAGGMINISSSKDGIQSTNGTDGKGYVLITGGAVKVECGSDGIKGETIVEITGGDVSVTESEEGMEALYIRIKGGEINVAASGDGVNASGTANPKLYIEGGNMYINAGGDGVDSNGSIYMNGGTLKVDGPENNGNGYFDYNSEFVVTGGTLIGAGSSGMLELPGESSKQNVVTIGSLNGQGGTEVKLVDNSGNAVMSYTPAKSFQAITFSGSDIKTGETYKVYCGENEVGTVTIENVLNYLGTTGGMQGGFHGGRGERPEGGRERPEGKNIPSV